MSEQRLSDRSEAPAPSTPPPEPGDAADQGPRPERSASSDEVADLEAQLRRALADLDNLRKRADREVARQRRAEREAVTARWLPVVDNLERALEHSGGEGDPVAAGVRAILGQATATLADLGFARFDDIGRPFDPARHVAVGTVDADAPPGTVVAAVQSGYADAESVLRPASVLVSKGWG